jgi:hypothetical protein
MGDLGWMGNGKPLKILLAGGHLQGGIGWLGNWLGGGVDLGANLGVAGRGGGGWSGLGGLVMMVGRLGLLSLLCQLCLLGLLHLLDGLGLGAALNVGNSWHVILL